VFDQLGEVKASVKIWSIISWGTGVGRKSRVERRDAKKLETQAASRSLIFELTGKY
jgi:hypothetical protein